jgi:hypothetical protein
MALRRQEDVSLLNLQHSYRRQQQAREGSRYLKRRCCSSAVPNGFSMSSLTFSTKDKEVVIIIASEDMSEQAHLPKHFVLSLS